MAQASICQPTYAVLWLLYRELVTRERDAVCDALQLIDLDRLLTIKDLADR